MTNHPIKRPTLAVSQNFGACVDVAAKADLL
jgi:hypothetical protein